MFTNQDFEDIVATACYGGIDYWADASGPYADGTFTVVETDTGNQFELTAESLWNAKQSIQSGGAGINTEIIGYLATNDIGMIDSITADCLVQIACFGRIVYG